MQYVSGLRSYQNYHKGEVSNQLIDVERGGGVLGGDGKSVEEKRVEEK